MTENPLVSSRWIMDWLRSQAHQHRKIRDYRSKHFDQAADALEAQQCTIQSLEAENARLRSAGEALKFTACHSTLCGVRDMAECDCGLLRAEEQWNRASLSGDADG